MGPRTPPVLDHKPLQARPHLMVPGGENPPCDRAIKSCMRGACCACQLGMQASSHVLEGCTGVGGGARTTSPGESVLVESPGRPPHRLHLSRAIGIGINLSFPCLCNGWISSGEGWVSWVGGEHCWDGCPGFETYIAVVRCPRTGVGDSGQRRVMPLWGVVGRGKVS